MKNTSNTLQNKAKFFGINLFGQAIDSRGNRETITPYFLQNRFLKDWSVLLTPLSKIMDEDLDSLNFQFPAGKKEIELTILPNNYKFHWKAMKDGRGIEGYLRLQDFDFLRSKGYALPWMDLSVEDLVNYGWVKLKQ